jgi:hypothetical protein
LYGERAESVGGWEEKWGHGKCWAEDHIEGIRARASLHVQGDVWQGGVGMCQGLGTNPLEEVVTCEECQSPTTAVGMHSIVGVW